jgi:cysteine-rich repeat protein
MPPGSDSDAQVVREMSECGNGVLEASEQCDDGNRVNGDGCSSSCQVRARAA